MFLRILRCIFLLLPVSVFSQNLTGIWKGHFTTGLGEDRRYYKYELQLDDAAPSRLSGISYSYLNTSFYGKSLIKGIYTSSNRKMDIEEIKLLTVKGASHTDVCLMHCKFSYSKNGKTEQLEGTYTSNKLGEGTDCGSGYILLERAVKSSFHIEPFLAKARSKKMHAKKKDSSLLVTKPKKKHADTSTESPIARTNNLPKELTTSNSLATSVNESRTERENASEIVMSGPKTTNSNLSGFVSAPAVFQNRKNKIIKTIITHTPEVDISFYDNGEIDDDSITVYHNLNRIIEHGRLSQQPIDYGFDASEEEKEHSFLIVADNLGKIPPNSVLMVIYTNNQRYEVFIESDLMNNGEVRIIYQPSKKTPE